MNPPNTATRPITSARFTSFSLASHLVPRGELPGDLHGPRGELPVDLHGPPHWTHWTHIVVQLHGPPMVVQRRHHLRAHK
eukprot:1194580-Prorocentrum_minimum.AAC.6